MREAMFYEIQEGRALCKLCPNKCIIKDGYRGICGTRHHEHGKLYAENYGLITGIQIDPVEKKPLAHWRPGTDILSLGSYGCNMKCPFCQNHHISQNKPSTISITPDAVIAQAIAYDMKAIAYTYNEPTVFYEFVYDTAKLAAQEGIANVLVTNGYINREPLMALLPYIDAMNIDVKTYDNQKMIEMCGGRLETIVDTIRLAKVSAHVEITMLIVPGLNDNVQEMAKFAGWLFGEVGDVPVHISRYFPRFEYDQPATKIELMLEMQKVVKVYFTHVYLGNVGV